MADIDDFDDEEERKRRSAASAPAFTYDTIAADVWTAVYYGIPLGAGPDLLRHAYDAAMQCAGAVAGPPGLSMHAFEPMQGELGADKSREENFEHAVRRLDELNSRLRPAMLDDEAERQAVAEQQPAAEKEPMTVEAIERDTWNAVDLDIPADADRAFLATVALAAEHCEKFAGAAAQVGQVMEPELVEFYQERQTAAADRRDEAWRQFTVRAQEQGSETRLLNPEQMQDRAMSSLHEQAHEHREAAGQGAEITHEALDKNPWVVLTGVLAEFDDRALLDRIDGTLHELRDEATQRRAAAGSPEEAELWRVVAGDAESRGREAREEIANLTARESADEISRAAEKEPMTIEAIERDRWNAVNQPIPEALSDELLTAAKEAVARCAEEAYREMMAAPVEFGGFDQDYQAARARGDELDEIAHERSDANEISRPLDAVARLRELENERDSFVIGAPDGTETHDPEEWRLQNPEDAEELERLEGSRPLGAAELAERVRRIIENPSLADAERDDRVLQVVEERREEQSQAEAVRQDDAPQVDSSQEPETQSTADRDAAEIDYLFGREEMTEARAAAYDRFTGQELSPRTSQTAGQVQEPGQSQSHSKGRSR
jgi:hypothetical protein